MPKLPLLSGLGCDLRRHRRERRITQAALAALSGLSAPTVRLLEREPGHTSHRQGQANPSTQRPGQTGG